MLVVNNKNYINFKFLLILLFSISVFRELRAHGGHSHHHVSRSHYGRICNSINKCQ